MGLFGPISGLFARGGGYYALAERYATAAPPPGSESHEQTAMLDRSVAYKRCVTFAASRIGLYMRPQPPGMKRHPAVLIPWSAIVAVKRTHLFWLPAWRLTVGHPRIVSITVGEHVFDTWRPYLTAVLQEGDDSSTPA